MALCGAVSGRCEGAGIRRGTAGLQQGKLSSADQQRVLGEIRRFFGERDCDRCGFSGFQAVVCGVEGRDGTVVSTGMDRIVSVALSLPAKSVNDPALTCTIPWVVLLLDGVKVAV